MSENPYHLSNAESPPDHLIRSERGRALAVASLVLLLLGTLASVAVIVAMSEAFGILAKTGKADPSELAAVVSGMMWLVLIGMVFTLLGAVLASVAVFGQGNRERWFLVLGLLVFVLQLGTFPLGTLAGIVLIFGVALRWREFQRAPIRYSDSPGSS